MATRHPQPGDSSAAGRLPFAAKLFKSRKAVSPAASPTLPAALKPSLAPLGPAAAGQVQNDCNADAQQGDSYWQELPEQLLQLIVDSVRDSRDLATEQQEFKNTVSMLLLQVVILVRQIL